MSVSSEHNKKNLNFALYIKRKCWKVISSVKTKKVTKYFQKKEHKFLKHFMRTTHINLIDKVLVDRINERQQEIHGLLDKKANS